MGPTVTIGSGPRLRRLRRGDLPARCLPSWSATAGRAVLMIEPGRALASNIGVLLDARRMVKSLARVKTWVNVDASQNHLANILSANWYYHWSRCPTRIRLLLSRRCRSGWSALHLDVMGAGAACLPPLQSRRCPGVPRRWRLRRDQGRRLQRPTAPGHDHGQRRGRRSDHRARDPARSDRTLSHPARFLACQPAS